MEGGTQLRSTGIEPLGYWIYPEHLLHGNRNKPSPAAPSTTPPIIIPMDRSEGDPVKASSAWPAKDSVS